MKLKIRVVPFRVGLFDPDFPYYSIQYKKGWNPFWRDVKTSFIVEGDWSLSTQNQPLLISDFESAKRRAIELSNPAAFDRFNKKQDEIYESAKLRMKERCNKRNRTFQTSEGKGGLTCF